MTSPVPLSGLSRFCIVLCLLLLILPTCSLAAGNATGAAAALNRSLDLDPGYSLPWPGMPTAQENLAAAIQAAAPTPAAPAGVLLPVAGLLVALAWPLRRR